MKDPTVGTDNLGLPIYKTMRKHRSMAILDTYCICQHYCLECYKNWSHKVPPGLVCSLFWIHNSCESCLTWNFNASKEDKLKQFTPSQRKAVIKWAERHGVKIK
jgi:hypothetical protein